MPGGWAPCPAEQEGGFLCHYNDVRCEICGRYQIQFVTIRLIQEW